LQCVLSGISTARYSMPVVTSNTMFTSTAPVMVNRLIGFSSAVALPKLIWKSCVGAVLMRSSGDAMRTPLCSGVTVNGGAPVASSCLPVTESLPIMDPSRPCRLATSSAAGRADVSSRGCPCCVRLSSAAQ
jgi:hypothetical protein